MLRESLKSISIDLSPWQMNELRSKNVTSIRQLLYQMYIGTTESPFQTSCILFYLGLKKHEQQRDAPFNGPVIYSTIESVSRPGSNNTIGKFNLKVLFQIHVVYSEFTLDQNFAEFDMFDSQMRNSRQQKDKDIDAMIEERRQRSEKLASLSRLQPMKLNKFQAPKKIKPIKDDVIGELDKFEKLLKDRKQRDLDPSDDKLSRTNDAAKGRAYMEMIKRESNEKRIKESERSSRRRKVLVDSIQDMFDDQQNERDRVLMARVTRESALERRLATQLQSIRDEKKTLTENRIRLNREFEADRLKKYNEYLDREAEVGRIQRATEKAMRESAESEHKKMLEKKAAEKRAKHTANCSEIVHDIVSFSLRISELNEQTLSNVPLRIIKGTDMQLEGHSSDFGK